MDAGGISCDKRISGESQNNPQFNCCEIAVSFQNVKLHYDMCLNKKSL